jgi:hypothetical protein
MMQIDPVPATILGLALAGLWAAAGVHKLRDFGAFSEALSAYQLLPQPAVTLTARLVPLIEIAVACGIVLAGYRRAAALASALLFALYGLAMLINLLRGRRELDCGCLGFGRRNRLSTVLVWRNAALLLASLAVGFLPRSVRALDWIDVFTVAVGAAAAVLIYAAVEGLASAAGQPSRRAAERAHV